MNFNQKTRSITQSHELTTLAEILPLAKGLLKDIEYTTHPIRLIGLFGLQSLREERRESPLGTTKF